MTAAAEKRPAVAPTPWYDRASPWLGVLLLVAVFVAYWPVVHAGYIWDDAGHVTRPDLRSLGGLWRIWTEPGATQQYYPLLHSAFWLESHLWGDAPSGYHIVNLLLHGAAAWLFALVLRRLAVPGAWIAAVLFALHPVAVESVAWIAEQKNTLSLVLYLGAAFAYLRFDAERRGGSYATATLLFFLALCTKTVSATLPAALLVVFWWKRGRLEFRRDVLPTLPWFALSLGAAIVTSRVEQTMIGATGSDFALDVVDRCLIAGRVIWFYLGKLLWPADLMFMYPRWQIDGSAAWQYLYPLAAVALVVALWWWRRRGPLAAVLFFAGSLFPALGFINVYPFIFSFVADHFQYLPALGLFALAGAGAALALRRLPTAAGATGVAVVAIILGTLTRNQTWMYRDEQTLYETTLARNPDSWMAHNNLGILLVNAGHPADALPHYEAALRLRPRDPEAENNFGYALNQLGRAAEAIPHFDRALQLQPRYAEAFNNRGIARMSLGQAAEGIADFKRALEANPKYPEAHLNLGLALARSGQTDAAIQQFAEAVRLRPGYAEAELNWAVGLTLTNQYPAAFEHYIRALDANPDSAEAHYLYGRALARANRLEDAVAQLRAALELNADFGPAHFELAVALRQLGRTEEAQQELQAARQLGAGAP